MKVQDRRYFVEMGNGEKRYFRSESEKRQFAVMKKRMEEMDEMHRKNLRSPFTREESDER